MADAPDLAHRLLDLAGSTFCERADIPLADKPSPLYRLLVLVTLLSHRIDSDLAVDAAAELGRAGWTTPEKMRAASWQDRVDALGRARYTRYDESTATRLDEGAAHVQDRFGGDLRALAEESGRDVDAAAALLQEFPGIGPVGADIFLREVQRVWSWVRPYAGDRVGRAALELGLPGDAAGLAAAAGTDDLSALSSALIEVSHKKDLRDRLDP